MIGPERGAICNVSRGFPSDDRHCLGDSEHHSCLGHGAVGCVCRSENWRRPMCPRREHCAQARNVREFPLNRCRGIQLIGAERGAVSDRIGLRPGDDWRRLGDRERHCSLRRSVVSRIGGSESCRQRMRSRCKQVSYRGSIVESSWNRRPCIELTGAERRTVGNSRGLRPRDGRRRLGYRQRHNGLCRRVIRSVSRREGRRERLCSSGKHLADGGSVVESSLNRCFRIELSAAERRAVCNGRGLRPRDGRRRLGHNQRYS